jgi:isopenicillin-N epimerase
MMSMSPARPRPSPLIRHWGLDPAVVFLNHGSFGATPLEILEAQARLRSRLEREPVRFLARDLGPMLDSARGTMADLIGCDAEDLVFVSNATEGVNTVLRCLRLEPGDEILVPSQEYNACINAVQYAAERAGGGVIRVPLAWPMMTGAGSVREVEDQIVEAVMSAVTPRTRLALLSLVTSPTALVMPARRLIAELHRRGVDTLLDAAHGPGFVPLDLRSLAPAYCTGNFHKWLCAPKGSAFLYVRRDRQDGVVPLAISHGHNSPRTDRSRFRLEFDIRPTDDPSAWLVSPLCAELLGRLAAEAPGAGLPAAGGQTPAGDAREPLGQYMGLNTALAAQGAQILREALGTDPPAPGAMHRAMVCVMLPPHSPDREQRVAARSTRYADALWDRLEDGWGIQVPIIRLPGSTARWVRISAMLYNSLDQYAYLARAIRAELDAEAREV